MHAKTKANKNNQTKQRCWSLWQTVLRKNVLLADLSLDRAHPSGRMIEGSAILELVNFRQDFPGELALDGSWLPGKLAASTSVDE